MWAYAAATLKQAYRSPLGWVLALLGTFTGWFAATAAILALDEVGAQAEALATSTSHLAGVLLVLWLVGRGLDDDRHSGFAASADATAPGPAGRLLGRWAGATAAGTLLAVLVGLLMAASGVLPGLDPIYLSFTSIQVSARVGAWAVLLGSLWRGGGTMLTVFLLWLLGHLPWGAAPFLKGPVGRALGAWLPGPLDAAGASGALGYTSAAVAGLLLATLALSRSADS